MGAYRQPKLSSVYLCGCVSSAKIVLSLYVWVRLVSQNCAQFICVGASRQPKLSSVYMCGCVSSAKIVLSLYVWVRLVSQNCPQFICVGASRQPKLSSVYMCGCVSSDKIVLSLSLIDEAMSVLSCLLPTTPPACQKRNKKHHVQKTKILHRYLYVNKRSWEKRSEKSR